ncbi:MAG: copper chaperone PCu(A)C [Gammaproteobacteria bacterium]
MIKYGIFAVMALLAGTLQAAEFQVGDITIEHAWSPPTPGAATVAAAYMVLRNKGSESERLLAASADIAKRVELHESKKEQCYDHAETGLD